MVISISMITRCLFYLYHQKIIVFENDRCIPIILAGLFCERSVNSFISSHFVLSFSF